MVAGRAVGVFAVRARSTSEWISWARCWSRDDGAAKIDGAMVAGDRGSHVGQKRSKAGFRREVALQCLQLCCLRWNVRFGVDWVGQSRWVPVLCRSLLSVQHQISAEQWGAATVDEVANGVHGVCALSMGMEREDRCE